jgi:dihydrofolate reductase
MARVINTTSMTVDGVIDVAGWYVVEGEHDGASRSLFVDAAGMLVGRKTFEGFVGYWPSQTGPWAEVLNPLPKFVASRSLSGPLDWNGSLIEGDAVDGVRRLKEELDGDLVMPGCGELARELITAGLVDELVFWIHPTVWGEGTRPYEAATIPMRLLEAKGFDSGVALLRYQPLAAG